MLGNTLLLTRQNNANPNSTTDTYSIWDAYRYGLQNNIQNFVAKDYYDIYFEYGYKGFQQEVIKLIETHSIQTLIIGYMAEDYTFDLLFLQEIKNKYNLLVLNTSQDPETFFEPRDRYYNQLADYILPFTVLEHNFLYKNYQLNAITLYSVYNKEMFQDQHLQKTIDVSFIGNVNKANRREYIDFLKENGINIQTYGAGSDNGFISHQEMMHIINASKINLNFTDSALSDGFDFNTNTNFSIGIKLHSRIQQAKGRLIEIYLTNSFCLSQDGKGTRVLFDDERILFNTKEELLEKIQYYLSHEEETCRIAQELHQYALKFDASNRFAEILPQIKQTPQKIHHIYVDKEFVTNYCSYHFLYFFNFLFKGKLKLAFGEMKIFWHYHSFDFTTIFYHMKMQAIYAYRRYKGRKK